MSFARWATVDRLIDSIPDLVLVIDLEGRVRAWNRAVEDATGFTAGELAERPLSGLLDGEGSIRTEHRAQVEHGAVLRRDESVLVTKQGERVPVSLTVAPVNDGGTGADTVSALVLVMRDIRDLRGEIARRERAEDALRAALASIEERLEQTRAQLLIAERRATLGTLAGGVGHELRNICQIQIAAIDQIEGRTDGTAEALNAVDDLQRVQDHIATHARHLMRLAKPGPEGVAAIDVGTAARDVAAMLAGAGRMRGVRVDVRLPWDGVLRALANPTRVEQVFVNLLANAADATMPAGGEIVVDAARRGDRVAITVRDSGCGMTPDVRARLFEPYFTTKGTEGTGLGLAVVREIVDSYGGTIDVETEVGRGTTITFDLPRAP
jgi:PAS domain S-box-containing protein